MELNNIYNFKNPVKHFLNIDGLIFPNNISSFAIGSLDWAEPVAFRIPVSYTHLDVYKRQQP